MIPLIILGQTATGKTETGVRLAQRKQIPLEIISADSRQVYKFLTIGTNKPPGKWITQNGEKYFVYSGVNYHLVDFLDPEEEYSAGAFVIDTEKLIQKISQRNNFPVIIGGTGFYISSFLDGLSLLPQRNKEIREKLITLYHLYGKKYLYTLLQKYDPERAKQIHPNNIHRVIRALEIVFQTGKPFSELVTQLQKTTPHTAVMVGLYLSKHNLINRIKLRTEQMFKNGIIEETKEFLSKGYSQNLPILSSIGYNWIIKFLNNELDLETTKTNFIKDTLKYAKNQWIWFKRDKRIIWINCDEMNIDEIVDKIHNILYTEKVFV